MSKIKVYFAGNMSDFYFENEYHKATEWRDYCKKRFDDCNIEYFDPTINSLEHFKTPPEFYETVIFQNRTYLMKCDILLLNLERFEDSIGSVAEVTLSWEHKKPIIAFGICPKWKWRPHFRSMIPVILPDKESACDYLISMFNQNL